MIFCSVLTCVASAIVLVAVGGETKYGLYVGTGMYYILIFILFIASFKHVVVNFLNGQNR